MLIQYKNLHLFLVEILYIIDKRKDIDTAIKLEITKDEKLFNNQFTCLFINMTKSSYIIREK